MDMFDYAAAHYPKRPGYQRTDTSKAAADAIESKCGELQRKVLSAIRAAGDRGMTIEECANAIGETRHSTQPRTSELKVKGLIQDSGIRRPLASTRMGICWVAA